MESKTKKIFLVLKIIAFELETANSHKPQHDTCNRQSMCVYKHPYDFKLEERALFPNQFSPE